MAHAASAAMPTAAKREFGGTARLPNGMRFCCERSSEMRARSARYRNHGVRQQQALVRRGGGGWW